MVFYEHPQAGKSDSRNASATSTSHVRPATVSSTKSDWSEDEGLEVPRYSDCPMMKTARVTITAYFVPERAVEKVVVTFRNVRIPEKQMIRCLVFLSLVYMIHKAHSLELQ